MKMRSVIVDTFEIIKKMSFIETFWFVCTVCIYAPMSLISRVSQTASGTTTVLWDKPVFTTTVAEIYFRGIVVIKCVWHGCLLIISVDFKRRFSLNGTCILLWFYTSKGIGNKLGGLVYSFNEFLFRIQDKSEYRSCFWHDSCFQQSHTKLC